MNRESMIDALVQECTHRILEERSTPWLMDILEKGFRGFGAMSDAELRCEVRHRKLDQEADVEEFDAGPEDDIDIPELYRLIPPNHWRRGTDADQD